jgi:hypothetical protein
MNEIVVREGDVLVAAQKGMDEFLKLFIDAIYQAVDGELTSETLQLLNASQITLVAYDILRSEVMDGGFVQLIHNGYGEFIFLNPFAKAMRLWGLKDLQDLIYDARKVYDKYHEEIEKECSDEEFMAMFEKFEAFDDFDDKFVANEEEYTDAIAHYVDNNSSLFAKIVK